MVGEWTHCVSEVSTAAGSRQHRGPGQSAEQMWHTEARHMTENPPYLLKALHQRARAFNLVHLPCPVQGLFDDVAEVIVVLQGRNDSSERYGL